MSKNENKNAKEAPSKKQESGGQRKNQNQQGNGDRRNYGKVLHPPSVNSVGNAGLWLEYHLTELRKEFGQLVGDMTEANKFKREEPVTLSADDLSPENDPVGLKRAVMVKKHEHYWRKLEEDSEKYARMYSVLWSAMSSGSQQLLKSEATFAAIETACNPHKLVELVKETHMCVDNHSQPVIQKNSLTTFYYGGEFRQFRNEPLFEFRKRFDLLMNSFDRVGLSDRKPDDAEAAWGFVKRLNDYKYPGIGDDIEYSVNMGVIKAPNDLDEAIDYIMKWERSNKAYIKNSANQKQSNMNYTGAAMFHTAARGGRGRGGRGRGRGRGRCGRGKGSTSDRAKNIECFTCHKMGHYASDCPDRKEDNTKGSTASNHVTRAEVNEEYDEDEEAQMYVTKIVMTGSNEDAQLAENEVLLDNQAQASVVHNIELLQNIRTTKNALSIYGINKDGSAMKTNVVGDLHEFKGVFYHPKAAANVLSQGEVEEKHEVDLLKNENPKRYKVTTTKGNVYSFVKKNRLYTRLFNTPRSNQRNVMSVMTVDDNEKRFPKDQVKRAREARRLSACLGHESDATLWKILHHGAYDNLGITPSDIRRAREIYGPSVPLLKGVSTHTRAKAEVPFKVEYNATKQQSLHVDIMFIAQEPFLISVGKPINLTMTQHLANKSATNVFNALQNMLECYQKHDFVVNKIAYDSESVLQAAIRNVPGIQASPVGPGQHEVIAESKIRRIKERMRAILHSLPYELPIKLLKWLVQFVVMRKNYIPVDGSGTRYSPRELFTGIRANAKVDLRIAFGSYAQVDEPYIDNTMKSRTRGALALYPVGNSQGSVKFFDLATQKIITRTSWTEIPLSNEVIEYINSLSQAEGQRLPKNPEISIGNTAVQDLPERDNIPTEEAPTGREVKPKTIYQGDLPVNTIVGAHESCEDDDEQQFSLQETTPIDEDDTTNNPPDLKEESSDDDDVSEQDDVKDSNPTHLEERSEQTSTSVKTSVTTSNKRDRTGLMRTSIRNPNPEPGYYNTLLKKNVHHTPTELKRTVMMYQAIEESSEFIFNMTVNQGIKKHGDLAIQTAKKEIKGILDKETFEPKHPHELNEDGDIIPSKMFLREKFLPDGMFDKLKARLVGGGHFQDRNLYPDTSSPTPKIENIFTIAALAAQEKRKVTTLDIGSAYLNASMDEEDRPVYMKLNKQISELVCEVDPNFKEYKDKNHEIIVKLRKALYGCIQSAKLWYKHIRITLENIGFNINAEDECIFNKTTDSGSQITIIVYVDDLLITCIVQDEIDKVTSKLKDVYKSVTMKHGLIHSYLGMTFNFSEEGQVKISMEGYIKDLIKDCNTTGTATSPANENLFKDIKSEPLNQVRSKQLHSIVARMLYLGTRVRPEILLTVNYLATRVNNFSEGDFQKATRCLQYLNAEPELGLTLRLGNQNEMLINLYADASFAVHSDSKSHSAGVVKVGEATVGAKSTKQKLVTRSTTEAELVCASDMLNKGLTQRKFLLSQGYTLGPVILHMSTIKMITNGKSTSQRTKHIAVRYFFMRERIDGNELKVIYTPTKDMIADILTKPLQGKQFVKLRANLLSSVPPKRIQTEL